MRALARGLAFLGTALLVGALAQPGDQIADAVLAGLLIGIGSDLGWSDQ